jgi:hypothetical protein
MAIINLLNYRGGPFFYTWSATSNMTNISQIPDMTVGDYIINSSGGTRTILGRSTANRGIVRATSEAACEAAGTL